MRDVRANAEAAAVIAELDPAARRDKRLCREIDVRPAGRGEPVGPRDACASPGGPADRREKAAARLERRVGDRAGEDRIDAVAFGREKNDVQPGQLAETGARREGPSAVLSGPDAGPFRAERGER